MKRRNVSVKKFLSKEERFADLWNGFLGRSLLEADKLENLECHGIRKTGQNGEIKELEHDLLKRSRGVGTFGVYGVEHQDGIDYRMVIRSMGYSLEAYERQIEELRAEHREKGDLTSREYLSGISKEDRIDPTAILVVYFGQRPWDGAIDLHSLFRIREDTEEYRKLFPNYRMNLLDVQRFPYIDRFKTDLRLVFGFLQRRSDGKALKKFIEENEAEFRCMAEDAYDVIAAYGGYTVLRKTKEQYKKEGGYDMCEALAEMMKEERMKGKKIGEKAGEKKGEEKLAGLIKILLKENLMEEVDKVLKNKTYRGKMYKKYEIS